jgi:hypothetical protein
VCGKGGRAGLSHCNLAACPSARLFDGAARTVVSGLGLFEEVQHVLCAIGCPYRKQVMVGILEAAAAPQCDEPGVSLLW